MFDMARLLKLLIVVGIVAAVAGSSAYVVLFADLQGGGNGSVKDVVAPTITSMGNTTGIMGKSKKVVVEFADNVQVTSAVLYYRRSGDTKWTNVSLLLDGYALIPLSPPLANYEYYVTVDDAAGNGPVGDPSVDGSSFFTIAVSQENVSLVHNVFIEEGTATTCSNCPSIANTLHLLELNSSLHFFYVSLIDDHSKAALDRLKNDYNYDGNPVLFVDGGDKVLVGGIPPQSTDNITKAIISAENRDVPPLLLKISAVNDNKTNQTNATVFITNYWQNSYSGTLRVYLAERVSVADYDGKAYHHGLVEIPVKENITVKAGETFSKSYQISTKGLDIENLEMFATVFNPKGVSRYARPDLKNNSFDAHFADACNHTVLVPGGNLPPTVGFTSPSLYSLNFFNREMLTRVQKKLGFHFAKNILCIGRPTISVNATDDSGIARVEFKIDNKLVKNVTQAPYQFKWPLAKISFGMRLHNVTAIAYDTSGKTATDFIKVRVLGL
jgi:hypothetical protein